ncbi:MAG: DUF4129 domain-containing protein [Cryobacterium sp.]
MTGLAAVIPPGTLLPASLTPDAPEARQWLREELSRPPYEAARPTGFDRASAAFFDWLNALAAPTGDGIGPWLAVIVTVLVLAALGAAWLIFGLPRLNRRSRLPVALFGDDDRRTADDMRRAAQSAAGTGDWSLASTELFRALARSLFERTVLTVTPGTTAHGFSVRAAAAFPQHRDALADAARVFDEVRYLNGIGTEDGYRSMLALDGALRATAPGRLEPAAENAS